MSVICRENMSAMALSCQRVLVFFPISLEIPAYACSPTTLLFRDTVAAATGREVL